MLGYDIAARILLNVSDWSQATMITAGEWEKGKAPKLTPEHRPWVEAQKKAKKKKTETEGVDINRLFSMMANKASQGR